MPKIYGIIEKAELDEAIKNGDEEMNVLSNRFDKGTNGLVLDVFDAPKEIGYIGECESDFVEDFEELVLSLGSGNLYFSFNKEEQTITFGKGFKRIYFMKKYDELLSKLSAKDGLEKFSSDFTFAYELHALIEYRFGTYVVTPSDEYYTLDEFIRCAKEDTPYYIYATEYWHN